MVLAGLGWTACAQTRIATIDMRRVFDGYWKTKAASADLRGRTEEYDQDFRKLLDQYQKANESFRQMVAQYGDSGIAPEEKKKLENNAKAKAGEIKEMETELNQFLQHSRTLINEKQQRLRANILAEINVVLTAKARAGDFDLVLDTSGESGNNVPTVAYTSGKHDLTEAVLGELNANAPVQVAPAAASETAPSPAQDPSAKNSAPKDPKK